MAVLFDDLWNYDDPAATETAFRELLPKAEAQVEPAYRLQLLTQIARAQGLQREFDAARATLDSVEEELEGAPPVARVRWLLERGRLERSSGHPEDSVGFFREAWEIAEREGMDFYAVDAAHMLGLVEPPEEALAWNRKAFAIAEVSEDPLARRWRGSLANNIGWAYFEAGEHEAALEMFEQALGYRREQGDEGNIRIAEWCVAKTQRVLGDVETALATQRDLHARYEADGSRDGYVDEEIAECLLALGRPAEAAPWFGRAHEVLSKDPWVADAEPERIARLKELSEAAP